MSTKDNKSQGFTRRTLLAASAMGALTGLARSTRAQAPSVAVIGAGAFGGWTALELLRRGARVTLVDTWGPGNSRASSGGETRVIRSTYGPEEIYVRMVARSLQLWQENEKRWNRHLFRRRGVLWFVGEEDDLEKSSLPLLREAGIAFEELSAGELEKRFPQINFSGIRWGIYEPDSGYLTARYACGVVLEGFLAEGGEFRQAEVEPGSVKSGKMAELRLSDGSSLAADQYVFACGPWLGRVFPDVIGDLIRPTRQEIFYFGTPPGDLRYSEGHTPVWLDNGARLYYGIPGSDRRGFKVADDSRGPLFDPTSGERTPSPEGLEAARAYLEFRFPGMKGAPLLESRVCTYENTIDQDFIVDRHPGADNAWIVGGGSGHGYKHGPAMGELVAKQVLGSQPVEPKFALTRF
ncbi:MAG: N-methyl-L-tryptophan oxidase [Acidobacteriota bacterium]|nr:MAG: N-methyl-L-tryptophan oxidase [Acidobacteriota bacterium]